MPISQETQQRMLVATRPAAQAFIEDMEYFRTLLDNDKIEAADIRRLSNEVRRLLIDNDGDLKKIAAPRIGKVQLLEPDNSPYYRLSRRHKFFFFGSGGVPIFKVTLRGLLAHDGAGPLPVPGDLTAPTPNLIPVRIDNFLSQRVLCFKEQWVTRKDVIKFVAHVAHGVHSGAIKTREDNIIETIRRVASYTFDPRETPLGINLDLAAITVNDVQPPFRYVPKQIDVVLVELLATVHFLALSPDVVRLETLIAQELRDFA